MGRNPKGNNRIPNINFQGQAVSFRGVSEPLLCRVPGRWGDDIGSCRWAWSLWNSDAWDLKKAGWYTKKRTIRDRFMCWWWWCWLWLFWVVVVVVVVFVQKKTKLDWDLKSFAGCIPGRVWEFGFLIWYAMVILLEKVLALTLHHVSHLINPTVEKHIINHYGREKSSDIKGWLDPTAAKNGLF